MEAKLWSLKDKFNDVSLTCGQGESKATVKAHKIILAGLVSLSLVFFCIFNKWIRTEKHS
jgi:hypothetical protein